MSYNKMTKQQLEQEVARLSRVVNRLEKDNVSKDTALIREKIEQKIKWEFVDLLPNAVFEVDLKGKVIFANLPGLKVFGLQKKDLKKGLSCFDLIDQQDHKRLAANMCRIIKKERVQPLSYMGRKKDGSLMPVVVQGSHISKGHRVTGIRGVVVDITQLEQTKRLIEDAKINLEATVRETNDELKLTNEKLERIVDETVAALASTVETRDPYTAGHQTRVSQLTVALGEALGYSSSQLKGLAMAASLHDVGKIYVPAEILSKPSILSKVEFEIIRCHSRVGSDILKKIEFPWPISTIVLQHHERLDGSGYPNKLCEDKILFESKIIAVADVVEAMASHRPYRPALGMKKALEEIRVNKGILYDTRVVNACTRLITKKGFEFRHI